MKLAKNFIDVGVQTNHLDEMLAFWGDSVGLPYEELLKVGGGTHQHRHALNGSVFKLNHRRDPLPESGPTGYRELLIARDDVTTARSLVDPDGNRVTLVPAGTDDVSNIGMIMRVRSIETHRRYFEDILQIETLAPDRFRWGSTVFLLEEDPNMTPCTEMSGQGYRYLTVQVYKVDSEHADFLARGGTEGTPPRTLGTTARISFICDPDGNWVEISQRASLTGDLSPG